MTFDHRSTASPAVSCLSLRLGQRVPDFPWEDVRGQELVQAGPVVVAEANGLVRIDLWHDDLEAYAAIEDVFHESGKSPRSSRIAGTPISRIPYWRRSRSVILSAAS